MLRAPFEGLVDTEAGPTFLKVRGEGPALLVFHGGPGFDHQPLLDGLAPVAKHRTLVFFDQLGCGLTPAPAEPVTAAMTIEHAAAVLDALGPEPIGLVAHSWGTVVASGALDRRPAVAFTQSLLINPVAVDGDGYAKARAASAALPPASAVQRMWDKLNAGAEGAEAFAEIIPYHLASPTGPVPRIPVTASTYATVDASLQAFDFNDATQRFGSIAVIRGDHDFVDPSTISALLERADHDIVLANAGHYPFFETPSAFADAMERVFA